MTPGASTDVARQQAAEVERAVAELTVLRARLESVEQRVGGANAAHSTLASRLEDLGAQIGRIGRLESAIDSFRVETVAAADLRASEVQAELASARTARERREVAISQEVGQTLGRLEHLEGQVSRLETEGRREVLRAELTRMAERLHRIETIGDELNRRPPRPEPTTNARIDTLVKQLEEVRGTVAYWQERYETQSEALRQAQIRADGLLEQARLLREEQNSAVQAQRIAEDARNAVLSEQAKLTEERWSKFLTARGHDWERLSAENASRAGTIRTIAESAEQNAAQIVAVSSEVSEVRTALTAEVADLRESLLKALATLRTAFGDATTVVETGVAYDQRSDVVVEKQEALRRALRAQRPRG